MSDALERYQKLKLRESLSRVYDYPSVCNELSFILRGVYAKVPKSLQSIIFEDTLSAIRLLPQVHTCRGKLAANLLIQAAEAALPKQKRILAVGEFKHAVVEHNRRCKGQKNEKDSAQLPQDVLIHLFSLLDMQSLVTVGLVCWSWSFAANENHLWKLQYTTYFGSYDDQNKQISKMAVNRSMSSDQMEASNCAKTVYYWKEAFKRAYLEIFPFKILSNRGYCGHCKSLVWLSNMKCTNEHYYALKLDEQQTKPISSSQVVEYLLKNSLSTLTYASSDSENDSDGESVSKLWAYQKYRKHMGSSRKKKFGG